MKKLTTLTLATMTALSGQANHALGFPGGRIQYNRTVEKLEPSSVAKTYEECMDAQLSSIHIDTDKGRLAELSADAYCTEKAEKERN